MFGVFPKLRKPLLNVEKGLRFCDIVDEKSPDRISIISVGDGPVPFLSGRVPDLSSDLLVLDLNVSCRKFDPNG